MKASTYDERINTQILVYLNQGANLGLDWGLKKSFNNLITSWILNESKSEILSEMRLLNKKLCRWYKTESEQLETMAKLQIDFLELVEWGKKAELDAI